RAGVVRRPLPVGGLTALGLRLGLGLRLLLRLLLLLLLRPHDRRRLRLLRPLVFNLGLDVLQKRADACGVGAEIELAVARGRADVDARAALDRARTHD